MNKKFSKSIAAMLSVLSISGAVIPTYAYNSDSIVTAKISPTWDPYFWEKKVVLPPERFVDKVRDFEYLVNRPLIITRRIKETPDNILKIAAWERTYDSFAGDKNELVKKIKDMIILKVIEKNKDGVEEEKFVPLNEITNDIDNLDICCTGSVATLKFNEGLRIDLDNVVLLDKNCEDENLKGKSDLEKVNVSGKDYYIDAKNKLVFSLKKGLLTVADARIYAAMALDSKSTPEEISFANIVKEKCGISYAIESKAKFKKFLCEKRPLILFSRKIPVDGYDGIKYSFTRWLYSLNNKGITLKELGGEKRTVSPYFCSDNNLKKIIGIFTSNEVEFNFDENLWKENEFCTENGEKKKVYVNERDRFVISVPYDKKIDVSEENCDVEVLDLTYAMKNKCFPKEILKG